MVLGREQRKRPGQAGRRGRSGDGQGTAYGRSGPGCATLKAERCRSTITTRDCVNLGVGQLNDDFHVQFSPLDVAGCKWQKEGIGPLFAEFTIPSLPRQVNFAFRRAVGQHSLRMRIPNLK